MKARAARLILGAVALMFHPSLQPMQAQISESGTVTLPTLKFTESAVTKPDFAGAYEVANLMPREFEVAISTNGMELDAPQTGSQPQAPNPTKPSLGDLGITPEQAQGNAREQWLLDKRTHMLKTHQRLGLITAVPLIATVITSAGAGGRSTSSTDRNVHMVLGSTTAAMYFTTAYFAIRAPKISGTETHGPIRLHKALAWIHGPGMIVTPILGAIAYSQKSNGEKVHGIASAHGPVAIVTAGAYGAAILAVSVKF